MDGTSPAPIRLITSNRARRALLARSGEGQNTASLKWVGLKLDGPGAEPLGKNLRALASPSAVICTGVGAGVARLGGWGDWGCLASISSYTSAEAGASPSDVRDCIAFLYWPSSIARRARLALATREDSEVTFLGLPRRWLSLSSPTSTSDQRPRMSPAFHLRIRFRTVFSVSRQ